MYILDNSMDFTTIMLDISLFLGLYFQIFLLVSFFEAEENEEKLILPVILPTVTIIVPCFNEAKTVEKTILSLMGLNYPMDKLNILVVDDGSVDDTFAQAQHAAKRFPNVRVVTQKNGGKYTALNLGIRECTTDIVGCLDADSMVHPDALIKMIPYFNDLRTMAVTPAMRVHQSKTFLQQIQRAEYNVGIFTKRVFGYLDAINVTPGPFSIFSDHSTTLTILKTWKLLFEYNRTGSALLTVTMLLFTPSHLRHLKNSIVSAHVGHMAFSKISLIINTLFSIKNTVIWVCLRFPLQSWVLFSSFISLEVLYIKRYER